MLLDIICTMIEKFGSQDFNKIKSKGLGNIREHLIHWQSFIHYINRMTLQKRNKGKMGWNISMQL